MGQSNSDILTLLEHISIRVAQQTDQLLWERLGIGLTQYRVLRAISEMELPTQRAIAAHIQVTEAGVSRQIKLLVEKMYIERSVNPKNRREQIVCITHKGERILQAASGLLQDYSDVALASLDERQRKTFLPQLGAVHSGICSHSDCTYS